MENRGESFCFVDNDCDMTATTLMTTRMMMKKVIGRGSRCGSLVPNHSTPPNRLPSTHCNQTHSTLHCCLLQCTALYCSLVHCREVLAHALTLIITGTPSESSLYAPLWLHCYEFQYNRLCSVSISLALHCTGVITVAVKCEHLSNG